MLEKILQKILLNSSYVKDIKFEHNLKFDPPFGDYDIINKNYLLTSIQNEFDKESSAKGILGELHYKRDFLTYSERVSIDLQKVSHVITNIELDDTFVKAGIHILNTPRGKLLKKHYDAILGETSVNYTLKLISNNVDYDKLDFLSISAIKN